MASPVASPPRNVWSVLFGETIMTWPRICAQQLVVLSLLATALNAHIGWLRWSGLAVAALTQGWIVYDASRRFEATYRARRDPARRSPRAIAHDRED